MAEANATALEFEVSDQRILLRLAGPGQSILKELSGLLDVSLGQRGQTIRIAGESSKQERALRVLSELVDSLEADAELGSAAALHLVRTLIHNPSLAAKTLREQAVRIDGRRKNVAPKTPAQAAYLKSIETHDVVFGIGPAGTGKTYLAMAMAVHALQTKRVRKLILTRPAVEAGERLGFLPGDLVEKVDPYLRPLYDALSDLLDEDKVQGLIQRGTIEVAPLAFMRGRTLSGAFVILDEAQNTTIEQMRMFLTRLGFDAQAVITGDITQQDLPSGQRSGLADAAGLLGEVEGIDICRFSDADVVRHPLVQRIVRAYEQRDKNRTR